MQNYEILRLTTDEIKRYLGDFESIMKGNRSGEMKYYNGLYLQDTGVYKYMISEGIVRKDEEGGYRVNAEKFTNFREKEELLHSLYLRREKAKEAEREDGLGEPVSDQEALKELQKVKEDLKMRNIL